jgi:WD40 repeat protein
LFIGGTSNCAYAYDLNATHAPVAAFGVEVPAICTNSSITFLAVGSEDGRIRLFDPSLRSCDVLHKLDAHSGGVRSLNITHDGTLMISAGYNTRAVNPYDPNSPLTVSLCLFFRRVMFSLTPLVP